MAPVYDPFGEPVDAVCSTVKAMSESDVGDRRARNVAVIGFWTIAAALTASRIYFGGETAAHLMASAQAQVTSLITAIL